MHLVRRKNKTKTKITMKNFRHSLRAFCAVCFAAFAGLTLQAQDENLRYRLDFEQVNGTTVTDAVASTQATLKNQASIMEMGKYHVLNLGNGTGYLDMGKDAGSIVYALSDFTMSAYYFVESDASLSGAGYFLWTFSQSAANTATSAPYTAYRLNVQRVATSTGGYQNEQGIEVGSESAKGQWVHVLFRQSGTKGQLYVDGNLVSTNTSMPAPATAFTAAPAYNWIGRAAFSSDNYLKKTYVADFRIYDCCVSDSVLAALQAQIADLEYEMKYGSVGDFSELKTTLQKARDFLSTAGTEYPINALAELQDEVNLAAAEVEADTLSQYFIDQRHTSLSNLLTATQALKGFDFGTASAFTSYGEHGFVHPGALHTQADFDRIKQLLAEGDSTITAAYKALCDGEYAKSTIATYPTETVWRSGSGDNYMNVARGAAMAYQNALVYKIGGETAHADAAVRILMAWARGNKYVSGNTNLSLAAGLYGYELANAAELVRDYEGWSREDFREFQEYILRTWYPATIDFLRRRHGTWDNSANTGAGGQRPGHYWSNWGLCNTLALLSYGVLLDDVHIYNQGLSFYKLDHVGTFPADSAINRTAEIQNWGCTEFIGNLVPTIHEDERGPFGYLGQMQESGRDTGHEGMALGLAVDICTVGLNQGDDLFAYMNDRLAAGIEFVAAHNFAGLTDVPWTNYRYCDCRTAWHNGWIQTAPNGFYAFARPYWDRVLGYYEGVRGVTMKYSEMAATYTRGTVGYDMGGHSYGETSGGYDHLGFSTLTCYRPTKANPATAPILLSGKISYNGSTLAQTMLGGLKYTFVSDGTHAIEADGAAITLMPQLPDSIADTGTWSWNTGETTRNLTVKADHSYIYRVTYTHSDGRVGTQSFPIAVQGDCSDEPVAYSITVDGTTVSDTTVSVLYGTSVQLSMSVYSGYGSYLWDNGATSNSITIPNITTSRDYTCHYTTQGGRVIERRFHITVLNVARPDITVNDQTYTDTTLVVVNKGDDVVLLATTFNPALAQTFQWSDGSSSDKVTLSDIQTSVSYSVTYTCEGQTYTLAYQVYVPEDDYRLPAEGTYYLQHEATGMLLTHPQEDGALVLLSSKDEENPLSQQWYIEHASATSSTYSFRCMLDSTFLQSTSKMGKVRIRQYRFQGAAGLDNLAIVVSRSSANKYLSLQSDNTLSFETLDAPTDFPYLLIPVDPTAIADINATDNARVLQTRYYSTSGQLLKKPAAGINLRQRTLSNGQTVCDKIFVR